MVVHNEEDEECAVTCGSRQSVSQLKKCDLMMRIFFGGTACSIFLGVFLFLGARGKSSFDVSLFLSQQHVVGQFLQRVAFTVRLPKLAEIMHSAGASGSLHPPRLMTGFPVGNALRSVHRMYSM